MSEEPPKPKTIKKRGRKPKQKQTIANIPKTRKKRVERRRLCRWRPNISRSRRFCAWWAPVGARDGAGTRRKEPRRSGGMREARRNP